MFHVKTLWPDLRTWQGSAAKMIAGKGQNAKIEGQAAQRPLFTGGWNEKNMVESPTGVSNQLMLHYVT